MATMVLRFRQFSCFIITLKRCHFLTHPRRRVGSFQLTKRPGTNAGPDSIHKYESMFLSTFTHFCVSTSCRATTRHLCGNFFRFRLKASYRCALGHLAWIHESPRLRCFVETWLEGMTHRLARNMMSNHTCSDRPLPTRKTSIVVIATIFTLFKTNTKETAKEVARPKAAPPLLYIGFE